MSWGACAFLAAICTTLSMAGWPLALQFLPTVPGVEANTVAIVSAVLGILALIFCSVKKDSGVAKFFFFLLVPLFLGVFYQYSGASALFFGEDWWKAILAAGTPVVLFLICMMILYAMDAVRHGFAFLVAGIFFFGIAVGLYFLIKMWIGEEIARLFTSTAMINYAFFSGTSSLFPE